MNYWQDLERIILKIGQMNIGGMQPCSPIYELPITFCIVSVSSGSEQMPFTWRLECVCADKPRIWGTEEKTVGYLTWIEQKKAIIRWFPLSGSCSLALGQFLHKELISNLETDFVDLYCTPRYKLNGGVFYVLNPRLNNTPS